MKILFLVQIFETPNDNGSDRMFFFAKNLVKKRHIVRVITGNIDYKNAVPRFNTRKSVHKNYEGVEVVYTPVFTNFRGSFFKRFIFYVSYIFSSLWELLKSSKNTDLIYGVSTPLTVPFISAIISKFRGVPFIFEVTDVWPDAAIHSGVINNKFIIFCTKKVENFCYRSANEIICLTEGIAQNIKDKGVNTNKIKLITNGVDFDLFNEVDQKKINEQKKSLNIEGKFIGMYLGAHGKYNSLDTILNAAAYLKNCDNFIFIFVGEGDEKASLVKIVKDNNLNNVLFYPSIKRNKASEMLAIADYFLLPNLKGSFFEGNLPNKLFDFLASKRPIIVSGKVESGRLVKKINAGVVIDAEEPFQLAESIKSLYKLNPEQRAKMGANGREYVKHNYNRLTHVKDLEHIIDNLIN